MELYQNIKYDSHKYVYLLLKDTKGPEHYIKQIKKYGVEYFGEEEIDRLKDRWSMHVGRAIGNEPKCTGLLVRPADTRLNDNDPYSLAFDKYTPDMDDILEPVGKLSSYSEFNPEYWEEHGWRV